MLGLIHQSLSKFKTCFWMYCPISLEKINLSRNSVHPNRNNDEERINK